MREFKEKYGEIMEEDDDPSIIIKKCIPKIHTTG
jgi:hypothetical protein